MTFTNELERDRRRKPDENEPNQHGAEAAPARAAAPRKRRGEPGEVGDALRTVYQRTIDEAIPPEMLDLLGKLG